MRDTTARVRLRSRLAGVLLAATALSGCATVQEHEREVEVPPAEMELYLSDKPAELHRLYAKVLTQGWWRS